jgi:hypothetical protein
VRAPRRGKSGASGVPPAAYRTRVGALLKLMALAQKQGDSLKKSARQPASYFDVA